MFIIFLGVEKETFFAELELCETPAMPFFQLLPEKVLRIKQRGRIDYYKF